MEAFFKITFFVGMGLEGILRARYDRQRREFESRTVGDGRESPAEWLVLAEPPLS